MSTLQTTILKHPDSGSNNIQFDASGNVKIGSNTLVAPSSDAENFVIDTGDADTGISILSATTGRIYFGDAASNDQGSIRYVHTDDSLRFETDSTEKVRLDSLGRLLVGLSTASDTVAGTQSNLIIESNSSGSASYGGMTLQRGTSSIANNTSLGRIFFTAQGGGHGARISGLGGGTWAAGSTPGQITFDTTPPLSTTVVNRMKIDENGAIAVGDPGDSAIGQVTSTLPFSIVDLNEAGGGATLQIRGRSPKLFFDRTNSGNGEIYKDGAKLYFYSGQPANPGTEQLRIDEDGRFTVSNSTYAYFNSSSSASSSLTLKKSASAANGIDYLQCRNSSNSPKMVVHGDGDVVNVNNSYGPLSSDERLKTDVVDANSQWDDIKGVRITNFRFKNDPEGSLQLGPIAQELELVSPGLITRRPAIDVEIEDESNDLIEGDEVLSFKSSVLYMKAVKALQEAMERIEQLEAKVAALEAG